MEKGLGQLEAYAGAQDGVALKMDNGMFWDSPPVFCIQAAAQKRPSCKFFVTITEPGKVALSDCRGWFLAPSKYQPNRPLLPLYISWQEFSEFKVFHKGNKVAFQTHDGCFLTKVFRGDYIVEASKTCVDSSSFFQPEIGTLLTPDHTILDVIIGDLKKLRFSTCVLKEETFVNQSEKPLRHTFSLTWAEEGVQKTAWGRRWGLGLTTMAEFTIWGTEVKAIIKYNQDNDEVVFVPQPILETLAEEVDLPPQTKATAWLLVEKETNATVPFMAKIRRRRPGGTVESLYEPGVWKGLVYHGLYLDIKVEPLRTRSSCAIL